MTKKAGTTSGKKPPIDTAEKPDAQEPSKSGAEDTQWHKTAAVRVRMYRHGLGDCFLLSFPNDFKILIDCGVILGTPNGSDLIHQVVADKPALTDPRLRQIIADAAKQLNLSIKLLPSGATHDAQSMARLAPAGMIFVPSIGGISHAPEEFSRPQDIVNGANVLLGAVQRLDARNW